MLVLPQRPYLPFGRLDEALSYPEKPYRFNAIELGDALAAVGLPQLVSRLAEEASWPHMLSQGEQQRLSLARALLQKPDILLLDEASSAIDEAGEAILYRLIIERLPKTTILSIGHRSTLQAFHKVLQLSRRCASSTTGTSAACRGRTAWRRSFAQMADDPTVYHTMNGPSEFHCIGSLQDVGHHRPVARRPPRRRSWSQAATTRRHLTSSSRSIAGPRVRNGSSSTDSSHMPHVEEPGALPLWVEAFLATID